MNKGNSSRLFILVLTLVGAVLVSSIYKVGGNVLEKLEEDCESCNSKTNATNLSAVNSNLSAIKSDIDGLKGQVEANKALMSVQGVKVDNNTKFIGQVQSQMKELEKQIKDHDS